MGISRCSRAEMSRKKGALKSFTNFTNKNPCQNLYFRYVANLPLATLFKKTMVEMFSYEFFKTYFTEHLLSNFIYVRCLYKTKIFNTTRFMLNYWKDQSSYNLPCMSRGVFRKAVLSL